jgi:uncharacterized protein YneF (UPF0154 family)
MIQGYIDTSLPSIVIGIIAFLVIFYISRTLMYKNIEESPDSYLNENYVDGISAVIGLIISFVLLSTKN